MKLKLLAALKVQSINKSLNQYFSRKFDLLYEQFITSADISAFEEIGFSYTQVGYWGVAFVARFIMNLYVITFLSSLSNPVITLMLSSLFFKFIDCLCQWQCV